MRTTMTIEDDLYARVEEAARREQRSVREFVRDALLEAVAVRRPQAPFRVCAHPGRLLPGVDPSRMNQLADELEDEGLIRRLAP